MKAEYKDFIGVFSDILPEGFCQHFISEFERNQALGAGSNRQDGEGVAKHLKEDSYCHLNGCNVNFLPFEGGSSVHMFFDGLQKCFEAYSKEFSVLKDIKITCTNMKIQKTSSGGGYHVWHFEQGNGFDANRSIAYMLYLNTLPSEANGETEFLYQQRRISPVENTMVLWPAAFTHAHRGNPVYGDNVKYIVTGWFHNE
jgi:hypothetical protein